MNEFILMIGAITFPYYTVLNKDELISEIKHQIDTGLSFDLVMDKDGPIVIINPAPGMNIIIMTKEQFERNRNISKLVGKA
jgi:hypothetical protein